MSRRLHNRTCCMLVLIAAFLLQTTDLLAQGNRDSTRPLYRKQPVASLALPPADKLLRDIEYLSKRMKDDELITTSNEFVDTSFPQLLHIDRQRPFGAYAVLSQSVDALPAIVGLLPVEDEAMARRSLDLISADRIEEVANSGGVFRIRTASGWTLYVKFAHHYGYVSDKIDAIAGDVPLPSEILPIRPESRTATLTLHLARVTRRYWDFIFGELTDLFSDPDLLPELDPLELLMMQFAINQSLPEVKGWLEQCSEIETWIDLDTQHQSMSLHYAYKPDEKASASASNSNPVKRESAFAFLREDSVLSAISYSDPSAGTTSDDRPGGNDKSDPDFFESLEIVLWWMEQAAGERARPMVRQMARIAEKYFDEDAPFEIAFFLVVPTSGTSTTWVVTSKGSMGKMIEEFIDEEFRDLSADERRDTLSSYKGTQILHSRFRERQLYFAVNQDVAILASGEPGLETIKTALDRLGSSPVERISDDFRLEYLPLKHYIIQKRASIEALKLSDEFTQAELDDLSIRLRAYGKDEFHFELSFDTEILRAFPVLQDRER